MATHHKIRTGEWIPLDIKTNLWIQAIALLVGAPLAFRITGVKATFESLTNSIMIGAGLGLGFLFWSASRFRGGGRRRCLGPFDLRWK